MRRVVWLAVLGVLIGMVGFGIAPVEAQFLTFHQGVFEFESYVPNIIYNGTWSTTTSYSSTVRSTSTASSWLQFQAVGETLVLWRFMRPTGSASSMNVCLGIPTVCSLVSNTSVHPDGYFDSYVVNLAAGSNIVTIEWVSGGIFLDKFMILDDSTTFTMPTAVPTVPTATILPSSTPAYTATPGPTPVNTATPINTPVDTPTAAPTATPYTLPDTIIAIEPNTSYTMVNGQIVAISYRVSAGDVAIIIFLALLLMIGAAFLVLRMGER